MPKRLLLVEDEALIALSESRLLEKHGFDVEIAHSGEKALEKVASVTDISLVLMDIDLGKGIDGTETARRILQTHELPIIFLTSHSEKEYVDRVEEISGYGYVLKNSGELVLVQSIRMAYKLFQAYRGMQESEEKYRAAFMTSPDSVNINRIDGLYVDINEGFTALTGYTREDVIGKLSSEIDIWAIPEDRRRLIRGLESDGYVQNLESRFRCKDGTLKTGLMSARLIMLKGERHILSITRDITEKKEIEERLQLAVEGSRDGIWDWNLLTNEAHHSARFATMLGYEPEELPYTSAAWSELIHPEDKDDAFRQVERYLSGEEDIYESTFRMRTKSGAYRWISGRGKAVFDDSGNATRFVGFNTDVTDYKRKEQEAQKARRFLDTISDIAYEADTNGTVTYVNPAAEQITGVPPEEIVGQPFQPLFREDDHASLMEVYARTLEGEVLENTLTFINGATCHFTTLPRYGADGTITGTFGIGRDITGWLHHEEELKEWRDMFRQMFMQHSAVQLLVHPDQDGRIIEANQAAVEFYGHSREQLLSMSISDINILPGDEIQDHMNAAHTRTRERFEFTHRLADGSRREVEVHSSPIRHEERWVLYSIIRDVSDRARAERELNESISRYHELETRIPVGVYIVWARANGDKSFEYVSKRWCELHGVSEEEVMADSAVVDDLVHPDDRESFLECNREAAEQNKPFRWEGRFFTDDGDVRWFRIESTPRAYENGDTRFFGVTQDITERRQAEDKYRSLFNYSNDAIFVHEIGDDGLPSKNIDVNDQAVRLLDYTKEELLNISAKEVVPEERASEMYRHAQELMDKKHLTFQTENIRSDGVVLPVEVSAYLHTEGSTKLVVSSVRDISARKQVEHDLTSQKQYLETILETTADGFWVVAPDKRIVTANAAYCRMSGYSRDELERMRINDLDAVESPVETVARLKRIMENGSEVFETRHRRKDGSLVDIEVSASRLDRSDGAHVVAFCRDITERKRMQEEAEARLVEKEILLREVHHRVKNTMTTIESLLSLQADSATQAEAKAALQDTISRVRSSRVLYDQLLISQELHAVSVRDYSEGLIDSLAAVFQPDCDITIEKQISEFLIDPKRAFLIGIILNELLTNVFKYAFSGRDSGTVSVRINNEDGNVTLIIQDNGVGFDERALKGKSAGFGLTVVEMLVKQLGGTYSVTNDNGAKSVMTFGM
jgi:PAS domain S-box-containing protein